MAFNTGFGYSRIGGGASGGSSSGISISYGRVVSIILDPFHKEYDNYGKSQSINGVLYRPLGKAIDEEESDLLFAYQGANNLKRVPLKGEIVKVISAPSEVRTNSPVASKSYWTEIVPLWNTPEHNAYPDTLQSGEGEADLGEEFEEKGDVNPLQPFPGDILLEGRQGQSLRFTGTSHDENPWVDSSNNSKPLIILSNGQKETDNGMDTIVEDINEDPTSIYITSDHKVELDPANTKRDAWDSEPVEASEFKGAQVMVNSDRLYFNSREESTLFSAKEAFGVNANSIHFDGVDYIGLDAKKIYLGKVALSREDEPVLLGQTTTDFLEDFIKLFQAMIKTMATMPPAPPAAIAKMMAQANAILPQLPPLKQRLPRLHSKKVFTE